MGIESFPRMPVQEPNSEIDNVGHCKHRIACAEAGLNQLEGSVAYPELVSRGVSKSRKFKWLVKSVHVRM